MGEKKRPGRRLIQLYAALLYNANLKGLTSGKLYTGGTKALCVPGLNCYSCPAATAACPLGSLQNALAASGHTAPWYALGILLLFGALLGRTVCGWLCPFGLVQELLHRLPTRKIKKSRVTRALSMLKYAVLAVFVVALPLYAGLTRGAPLPGFCKYICPAGTLEGAAALLTHPDNAGLFAQLGGLFTGKALILLAAALLCVFCYRAFCRFLCPLGAIYGLFNRFALIGVRADPGKCIGCGACVRHCEMDVRRVADRECISCGQCAEVCPTGAIALCCGSVPLTGSPRKRRILGAGLLALLLGALVYFNFIAPPGMDAAQTASAGPMIEDFSCTLLDGSAFRLSDCRGKIVFINQWATYCAPCVTELPYFERLQEEHPDVVVLAVHHWLETDPDARAYVAEMGWNGWQIKFAVDTPDGNMLTKIGGDNVMPRTAVLNPRGEIIYNEQRSLTYEMLCELLELASN